MSSDNYNAIILPADYAGDFEKTFNGTGPFKIEKYTPKVGATFVRNDGYWGPKALLDRIEFLFFTDMQPQILALQGDQVDVINQLRSWPGVGLLNDPNIEIIALQVRGAPAGAHALRHGAVRGQAGPAGHRLGLDRPRIVQGLFMGRAKIGNDSPFVAALSPPPTRRAAARDRHRQGQGSSGRSRQAQAASR